jgi:hypothetical protein
VYKHWSSNKHSYQQHPLSHRQRLIILIIYPFAMSGHKRTRSYSASDIVPNARSRTQSNPHLEEEDMLPPDLSPDAEEFIPLMLKLGITGMEPMDPSRSPSPLTPLGLEGEEESEEEEEGDEGDSTPNIH